MSEPCGVSVFCMKQILKTLVADVGNYAGNLSSILMNERDLQVQLAIYLDSLHDGNVKHYDEVMIEYAIPIQELGISGSTKQKTTKNVDFPWTNNIYVDIVVRKGEEYAAIELKYATKELAKPISKRFGEPMVSKAAIIKNQGATDLVMYNYCKDIRRIERLTNRYRNFVGGVALIISNDHLCWTRSENNPAYMAFSLHEGNVIGPGLLSWRPGFSAKIVKSHPDFRIYGQYVCQWPDTAIPDRTKPIPADPQGNKFRYMVMVVDGCSLSKDKCMKPDSELTEINNQ